MKNRYRKSLIFQSCIRIPVTQLYFCSDNFNSAHNHSDHNGRKLFSAHNASLTARTILNLSTQMKHVMQNTQTHSLLSPKSINNNKMVHAYFGPFDYKVGEDLSGKNQRQKHTANDVKLLWPIKSQNTISVISDPWMIAADDGVHADAKKILAAVCRLSPSAHLSRRKRKRHALYHVAQMRRLMLIAPPAG